MQIGAHVSVAGGVQNAVQNQIDVGGNCGQIFTTSPQVWETPDITESQATAFRDGVADHGLDPWMIHSSYLVNLCTPKPALRDKSVQSLQAELDAATRLDIPYVNVHLGAHTGAGIDAGLSNAATAIDRLSVPSDVTLVIESDAGAGTKLGSSFEELAAIQDRTDTPLAYCLDTAHLYAAGYDLSTPGGVDETIAAFDATVGLERLVAIHLNDSKHGCGTHKDEHAHLGDGELGDDGVAAIINHDALRSLPFILETPTEDGRSYAWNVEKARELRAE